MTHPKSATQSRLARLDNWSLRAITGGALIFAVIGLVATVFQSVQLLSDKNVEVGGLDLVNAQTPAFIEGASAIVAAHYDTATLTIAGLPGAVRWLLVSHSAVESLLGIGLSVIVFILGMRLLSQRPFTRTATGALMAASILVIVVGMVAPFLGGIADAEAVAFLGDAVTGGQDAAAGGPAEGLSLFVMYLDPAPIGWGFALAVIASTFQLGQRMQRDTEGLI